MGARNRGVVRSELRDGIGAVRDGRSGPAHVVASQWKVPDSVETDAEGGGVGEVGCYHFSFRAIFCECFILTYAA